MRSYIKAFAMCQSMFCAIPFPWNGWDDKAKDKLLLFLPLVGLEIGLCWSAAAWLAEKLFVSPLLSGLLMALFPFFITGFIHLDGYMDVTDAISSWRTLERRREILKDSHVGSFAVIGVVVLLLTQFALLASREPTDSFGPLCLIPVVSRCCSGIAVAVLPPMETSQYANRPKQTVHILLHSCLLAAAIAAGFFLFGKYGFSLLGCLVGYALALLRAYGNLKGMNGDISGFALTIGELCAVAVFSLL